MFRFNLQLDPDNDDEGDVMGMRQALPVAPLPEDFDPTWPPSSGEEYLQHVVYESKKFAPIFTAMRIDESALNARCDPEMVGLKPNLPSSPLAPTKDWENHQLETFTKLRNSVHDLRLNKKNNESLSVPDVDGSISLWKDFLRMYQPLLTVVFAMRQEQLQRALQVLLHIYSTENFKVEHGAWVYAICACLDHPLSREACGDLRDIARKCAADRNLKKDPDDKEVAMINLIITLVVKYFKQSDLCDES